MRILKVLFLAIFAIFLCSSSVVGWGKKKTEKPAESVLSVQADFPNTSSYDVQLIDQGAILPGIYSESGQALWESLPILHQFWVIDSPLMQEGVSQRFAFPFPNVDFETHNLVFLFQGKKETGGYAIRIKKVEENATQFRIWIVLEEPGKNCAAIQSLTTPFVVLKIPVTPKKLQLLPQQKKIDCTEKTPSSSAL